LNAQATAASTQAGRLSLDERPRSLSDIVFETVHQAIVDRVLAPGEAVTEPGLAERLNVSKTPVREALLRLRQVGLIEADGARGLRVVRLSGEGVRQTYEIREALESFTAARAAELATPEERERILAVARVSHDAAVAGDIDGFRTSDRELHREIASVAQNPRVSQLIEDAGALIGTLLYRDIPTGQGLQGCGEAHVRIANAIAARDGGAAQREMVEHIRQVMALRIAALPTPLE
jgi:DNA-binding GntR family transcriptional regulator